MGQTNIIYPKSFKFALKIVKIYQALVSTHKEYVLSKQILRSGTSIGANVSESRGAFSKKDFEYKLSIAYKEAKETAYWLNLLAASGLMEECVKVELMEDVEELQRLLGSALITLRKNTH